MNYELTDEQGERIQPLLPLENTGKKGRPRKDGRTMLTGKAPGSLS
jgi:transposase|nr:transposase [uncultured Acetatifactor sp.]